MQLSDTDIDRIANKVVEKLRAFENVNLDAEYRANKSPEELIQWMKLRASSKKNSRRSVRAGS